MCRGVQTQEGSCGRLHKEVSSTARGEDDVRVGCELCEERATLYCQADDAYLCRKCDGWVHGANFLALRHIRCLLCNACQGFTQRYLVGASVEVTLPTLVSLQQDNTGAGKSQQSMISSPSPNDDVSLKLPFLFL